MNFPRHSLTLIVKGTFDLKPGAAASLAEEPLFPTGDLPHPDDEEGTGSPRYESDFAYFKPRADLLLAGTCHVPGGQPTEACQVSFRVGEQANSLVVVGDRVRERSLIGLSKPSDPKPFTEMPLRYENSYGGAGYPNNPVGKGHAKVEGEGGKGVRPVPNVVTRDDLDDGRGGLKDPPGFGPLSRSWARRSGQLGTYKGAYVAERWPWFPEDFDWGHFNAAPAPLQVDGYLRGDERIALENLHPVHPLYESNLPGLRARCFVNRTVSEGEPERFEEVPLHLDTLWVDADAEKLVLVWRGWTPVNSKDFDDVADVFVHVEPLDGEPASVEACQALFHLALEEEEEPEELEPAPVPEPAPDQPEPAPPDQPAPPSAAAEKAAMLAKIGAQTAAAMALVGLDMGDFPPEVQQGIQEQQAKLVDSMVDGDPTAALEAERQKAEAQLTEALSAAGIDVGETAPPTGEAKAEQVRMMQELGVEDTSIVDDPGIARAFGVVGAMMTKLGLDPADLSPLITKLKGILPKAPEEEPEVEAAVPSPVADEVAPLAWTRESVAEAAANGASLGGESLTGLDLSGLSLVGIDLSGADLSGATLSEADLAGANLSGARLPRVIAKGTKLDGASLAEADLTSATLEGASLVEADLAAAVLVEAVLTGANITGAVLEGANASASILDGVEGPDARIVEANLTGASLQEAKLPGAELSESLLDGANFRDADLTGAILERVSGTGARFLGAKLTGLRASESDLSGGVFTGVTAPESLWEGARLEKADLSFGDLKGAFFPGANLQGANLTAANLRRARLAKADLREATLLSVNLFEGSLEGADLREADLSGSNLYGVEFLDAVLAGVKVDGANLKMTKLSEIAR